MKRYPRVLVGAPVYDGHKYCIKRYLDRVKNLTYPNYDIFLADNSKDNKFFKWLVKQKIKVVKSKWDPNPFVRLTQARNCVVDYFMSRNYDYLMSIDTDTIVPRNAIEKLLKHKKDIVGFLCHIGFKNRKHFIYVPAILKSGHIVYQGRRGLRFESWENVKKMKPLQKVYGTTIGCALIKREIFQTIRFRYTPFFNVGEDVWFFAEANQKGFEFWLDKTVKVIHLNKDRRKLRFECQKARKGIKCPRWKK